jgi:hypothetical protein
MIYYFSLMSTTSKGKRFLGWKEGGQPEIVGFGY